MANRKRGTYFLPQELQTNERLSTKKELAQRKSIPLCPPVPYKMRKSVLANHGVFDKPKPLCFTNSVALSPIYNPTLERSYFEQTFARHALIGEGSFGQVYRARSLEDGQLYAIKRLKSVISFKDRYAEIRNNEKVGVHPNCVRFFMAWEEGYEVYMLLEYCQLSLSDFSVLNNDIPEDLLWGVLYDICKALHYLHGKNLLHLDVKPGNIMMKNGHFKLADFGILVDLKLAPLVCKSTLSDGDSKYLALEVLEGIYQPSCDIFGLGISLLELAADLELPSHGPLWQQLRHEILPQRFYDRVSLGFKVVIERMLKPEYTSRPSAEKILKYSSLKAIEKRDKKSTRVDYAADFSDNDFDIPIEEGDLPIMVNNNNIIETPHCVRSISHISNYDIPYRSIRPHLDNDDLPPHHPHPAAGLLNRKILFPAAKHLLLRRRRPKASQFDSAYESADKSERSAMSLDEEEEEGEENREEEEAEEDEEEEGEHSVLAVHLGDSYRSSDSSFSDDMETETDGGGSGADASGCFVIDDDDIITSTPLSRCKLRKDMPKTKLSFE
ncbi:unnamed protein product [Phaedon cochleariae]|uniref:non-specific serine/threonine protein kinase n=1 Tax=Phaedon cochleariae TaxID=80249 RepID=A0A9N9X1I8_PHACE|nr:unnamed protein product [Phaedon cochleariae]